MIGCPCRLVRICSEAPDDALSPGRGWLALLSIVFSLLSLPVTRKAPSVRGSPVRILNARRFVPPFLALVKPFGGGKLAVNIGTLINSDLRLSWLTGGSAQKG